MEHLWDERLGSEIPRRGHPRPSFRNGRKEGGLALPVYRQIGREGSEHEPVFLVEVKVGTQPAAQGRGQTKRDAESAAASALLDQLNKGN